MPSSEELNPQESAVGSSLKPFVIRFQNDETFNQNRDVLDGLTFVATLQLRTPLAVLQHHGEFHPGPPSAAPKYASLADGFWSYKTKSWAQLAGRQSFVPEEPETVHASNIGPIKASNYLPFLKRFREIVERQNPINQKLSQLQELRNESSDFHQIWSRLENTYADFPTSFFYLQLAAIPGIGPKLAKRLFESGLQDITAVQNAADAQLKSVPGLGSKLISRIRSHDISRSPTLLRDAITG
jgi:hypothetical protein